MGEQVGKNTGERPISILFPLFSPPLSKYVNVPLTVPACGERRQKGEGGEKGDFFSLSMSCYGKKLGRQKRAIFPLLYSGEGKVAADRFFGIEGRDSKKKTSIFQKKKYLTRALKLV